ncbi:unnamed protein product [Mytilus edulis]|uniref:CCHC-type domain-containing protein n=1 Tax=Mytilus edulis TaxID=6550 RepID=A0A8S3RST1_MYTED|nr:unnamed protein product [Mytilus edulis]
MSQPVNINTATVEELKSIKSIGTKRAGIITAAREERGQLTIEDLKLLEGIPNTIWDPLVDEGAIVVEPLERTKKDIDPKQRVRELEEQMSGMNAIIKQRMQEKQVALQEMQHQMETMQDEFEKRLTEQNAKFQKCIEQMEHDHKENTDALSVDFEKRENEMREEIRIRDNKMKQADEMRLTTERIEKLFPSGIYSKQEDRKPLITALKSSPGYTPKGNLQDRSEKRVEGPSAPKYKWTPQHRLDKLIECLRDKALKFYSVKAKGVQEDYDKLCNKLNERFGRRDLPHIIRRQLQDLKQDQDETLEEYTERTQEMATDGYPDTPEAFVEIVAIDAFLKGCLDKKAALTAMDKNPTTLDESMQYVKSAITNQRIILGAKRVEMKRVTFDDEKEEIPAKSDLCIRNVKFADRENNPSIVNLDQRLKKTEEGLEETRTMVKDIWKLLTSNRSKSPPRQFPNSPVNNMGGGNRDTNCFSCGKPGHYARDCRSRSRSNSPGGNRSRSPSPSRQLNWNGLKM